MGPQVSFEYRAVAAKFVGPHMEFRARKEPTGEGEDLLDVNCITLDRKMAQPITPGITRTRSAYTSQYKQTRCLVLQLDNLCFLR